MSEDTFYRSVILTPITDAEKRERLENLIAYQNRQIRALVNRLNEQYELLDESKKQLVELTASEVTT